MHAGLVMTARGNRVHVCWEPRLSLAYAQVDHHLNIPGQIPGCVKCVGVQHSLTKQPVSLLVVILYICTCKWNFMGLRVKLFMYMYLLFSVLYSILVHCTMYIVCPQR